MQDSSNLDSQLKILISKSSKTKPYGFALVPESEDGTPALFIEKKEAMARKEAKEELKVAKKKQILTGLAYVDDGKLHMLPGIKALKEAVLIKFLKKLKLKTKRYKSLIGGKPIFPIAEVVEENFEETEKEKSSESNKAHANPKYIAILEKLRSSLEDVQNEQQDTSSLFQKIAAAFQSPATSPSASDVKALEKIEGYLSKIATTCQELDAKLEKFENYVNINDKDNIKTLGKEIQSSLKKQEEMLVKITEKLNSFDISESDFTDSDQANQKPLSEMSNIEIFLKQAKALRASAIVRELVTNNPEPGMFDKLFANRNKKIKNAETELDGLINQIEILYAKENKGEGVASKEEKECEARLFKIRQAFSDLLVQSRIPNSGNLSEKINKVWEPSLRQAQTELQRFKAAVFAHPVVNSDPSFAIIQKAVTDAQLTLSLPSNITSKKELTKVIKTIKDSDELKHWMKIDSSSLFGSFAVAHPILQSLETLSDLK